MYNKLLVFGLLLFFVLNVNAIQIPNGSFETGDFTSWHMTNNPKAIYTNPDRLNGTGITVCDTKECLTLRNFGTNLVPDSNVCFVSQSADINININFHAVNDANDIYDGELFSTATPDGFFCFSVPSNFDSSYSDLIMVNGQSETDCNYVFDLNMDTFPGSDGSYYAYAHSTITDGGAGCQPAGTIFERVDNFTIEQPRFLTFDSDKNPSPVQKSTDFVLGTKILDENGINVTDSNVQLNFNGGGWDDMVFSSTTQFYEITIPGASISTIGDFNYGMRANKNGYFERASADKSVTVKEFEFTYLTITPIENIATVSFGSVIINPTNKNTEIIFKVDSNSITAENPEYVIINPLTDGKQYFVYTATQVQFAQGTWIFNDSLTFNSSFNSEPIQKIWDSNNGQYGHSFFDLLSPLETKYYRLTYESPAFFWAQQNDDWFKQLTPTDFSDSGITWDSFTLSFYTNLANYPHKPLSQLIGNNNVAYEFQFTGYTADLNADIGIYLIDPSNNETLIETVNLTTTKTRFSISINPSQFSQKIELKTDQNFPVSVFLVDYAIVPRGYFISPLELLQVDGSELPILVRFPNFFQYVVETENVLAQTTVYDREGDLNQLIVTVFFDVNADSNATKRFFIPLSIEGESTLSQTVQDIIDLTDTAQNIIVKFTLFDTNGLAVSEQSKTIRFLQWPFFPTDLTFSIADNALLIGDSPNGVVSLTTKNPNNILGVEFYIYNDTNSPSSPNFFTQVFTPQDFICVGSDCSFNYSIPDFVFSRDSNKWFITGQVLMRTRTRTVPSLTDNAKTYVYTLTKPINFFALKTARVIQTFERRETLGIFPFYSVVRKYKNNEQIALTVELQNVLNDDIRKDLQVWIQLFDCADNATGACPGVPATYVYNPTSNIYDPTTGKNYFFFKNLFLTTPDSNFLQDGNYFRVVAFVSDASGRYDDAGTLQIYLGDKDDSQVITNRANASDEKRILIDNSITLSPPEMGSLICLRMDTNLVFDSPRKPTISCFVSYSIKNSFPDKFIFRLSNNNSDTTETDDSFKQFIDFEVPYDLVAVNDIQALRRALNAQYHTSCEDWLCTLGQFANSIVSPGINLFGSPFLSWTLGDINAFTTYNVASDFNLAHFADPTFVTGILAFQISNTNFINKKDFETAIPELENVNPGFFVRFMRDAGHTLPSTTTKIVVYSSSIEPFLEFESPNFLVIDEKETESAVQSRSDSNGVNRLELSIPTILQLNLGATMVFDHGLSSHYLYVPLIFKTIIGQNVSCFFAFPSPFDFLNDPMCNPLGFLLSNIIIIVIVIALVFILAVIYREFKGGS